MNNIVLICTVICEWCFGYLSKKKNIKTDLIPYQNLLIGTMVCLIEFIITKDFKSSLMFSGLFAGGIYDLFHNIKKMKWYQDLVK